MTSFRALMPAYKGYAQFGYRPPVWENNAMQKAPHTKSSLMSWTNLSATIGQADVLTVTGGANWRQVEFQSMEGGVPTSATDIPLNRLWNTLQGSLLNEEAVGLNHDINPHGTQEFETTKKSLRVRKAHVYFQISDNGPTQVECVFLVWRSDAPGISTQFDPTVSAQNDLVSGTHDTPGAIGWTCNSINIQGAADSADRKGYKKITFDIPQYFADVEWHNDSPNTGASGGSGTNFWVDKDANNLFTAEPNLTLFGRLYLRYPTADGDLSRTVFVETIVKWEVELHTGQDILPSPAGAQ